MKPEEEARRDIDDKLQKAGWTIQHRSELNLGTAPGIAVREFPTNTGPVDYALFAAAADLVFSLFRISINFLTCRSVTIQASLTRIVYQSPQNNGNFHCRQAGIIIVADHLLQPIRKEDSGSRGKFCYSS